MAPLTELERILFDNVIPRDRETLSRSPGGLLFRLAIAEHGNDQKNT